MRVITKHYRRIKMKYYYKMTKVCLNRADKHVGEDKFWTWMNMSRKYTNKYIELYCKAGL